MKKNTDTLSDKFANSRGMSMVELVIVLLIIAILAAATIPQLLASRRLLKFSGTSQQLTASLRDARQLAMSQNTRITLRYDDTQKVFRTFGGTLGIIGADTNRLVTITDNGLLANEVIYGVAPVSPIPSSVLADTSILTDLDPGPGGVVDVTFNAKGDVVEDVAGTPVNRALFFYESNSKAAFAVSILGPGGRTKIWKLNGSTYE